MIGKSDSDNHDIVGLSEWKDNPRVDDKYNRLMMKSSKSQSEHDSLNLKKTFLKK
jgi:hypothetical protein